MEQRKCKNCFASYQEGDIGGVCPECGWDVTRPQIPEGLPYETELNFQYEIGRAKAMNGEGITYAAWDSTSRKPVEIREFYPVTLAQRGDRGQVRPMQGCESSFEECLEDFLQLSRGLSRFRELSAVQAVTEIFEENGSCYAVYTYVPSITLRRYIEKKGGKLTWNEVSHLVMPVVSALGLINSLGIAHLGLSPETLRVNKAGQLMLTGFSIQKARSKNAFLPDELFPGFAALEQYAPRGVCGETSDVYAMAAVIFYGLTGEKLLAAKERENNPRLMISKEVLKTMPPYGVTALANALQIVSENRTASFERLKTELSAAPAMLTQVESTDAIRHLPEAETELPHTRGLPPAVWLIGSCVITLVALFFVANAWLGDNGMSFQDIQKVFSQSSAPTETVPVPSLVNESYEDWANKTAGDALGFKLKVSSREFSDTVAEGNIISQSPFAGESILVTDTLLVTVSRGSAMRVLPEIKGLSFPELAEALQKSGFVPVRQEEASADVEVGNVIRYQDHKEGDSLEYGSSITVIVSSGQPVASTPEPAPPEGGEGEPAAE